MIPISNHIVFPIDKADVTVLGNHLRYRIMDGATETVHRSVACPASTDRFYRHIVGFKIDRTSDLRHFILVATYLRTEAQQFKRFGQDDCAIRSREIGNSNTASSS